MSLSNMGVCTPANASYIAAGAGRTSALPFHIGARATHIPEDRFASCAKGSCNDAIPNLTRTEGTYAAAKRSYIGGERIYIDA